MPAIISSDLNKLVPIVDPSKTFESVWKDSNNWFEAKRQKTTQSTSNTQNLCLLQIPPANHTSLYHALSYFQNNRVASSEIRNSLVQYYLEQEESNTIASSRGKEAEPENYVDVLENEDKIFGEKEEEQIVACNVFSKQLKVSIRLNIYEVEQLDKDIVMVDTGELKLANTVVANAENMRHTDVNVLHVKGPQSRFILLLPFSF